MALPSLFLLVVTYIINKTFGKAIIIANFLIYFLKTTRGNVICGKVSLIL